MTNKTAITNRQQILDILEEQGLLADPLEVRLDLLPGLFYSRIIDSQTACRWAMPEAADQTTVHSADDDPFSYLQKESYVLLEELTSTETGTVAISPGDRLSLRFFSGSNALVVDVAIVEFVEVQGKQALMVTYPKELGVGRARSHTRTKIRDKSRITVVINNASLHNLVVRPLDIAEGGLSFSTLPQNSASLINQTPARITLRVYERDDFSIDGIIRCDSVFPSQIGHNQQFELRFGVQFIGLSAEQKETLRGLIYLAQQEFVLEEKKRSLCFSRDMECQVREKTTLLRQKDMQLLEMDRLVGIATLAAGMAHEINTPLGVVKSTIGSVKKSIYDFLGLFQKEQTGQEGVPTDGQASSLDRDRTAGVEASLSKKFDRIFRGIDRIDAIIQSLKDFSNLDCAEIREIDINTCLNQAFDILNWSKDKEISIVKDLKEIPTVTGIAGQLNQCLLQVLNNGLDAIGVEGTLTVSTCYDADQEEVTVQVADNGIGMSPEVLRMALHPFFTTKPVGSGTGMGLALTERIVNRHGGRINLTSQQGTGTTVTIILPTKGI